MSGAVKTLADIQAPDGSPVPRAWTAALMHLNAAEIERASFRSAMATPQVRDDAAVRFGQAIEKLFEQMLELQKSGAAGVITAYLCKRGK